MSKQAKGQALILLVFSVVALIGMVGLAVDGGRLYLEKRRAQNAVDSAALAAALVIAQASNPDAVYEQAKDAAIAQAADNGYTLTRDQISITKQVEDGAPVYYVTARLDASIPPALIQLVYHGPLKAQAEAQVRVRPRQNIASGYALAATNEHVCNAINIHLGHGGSLTVDGGIFSNTDATESGGRGGGAHGACVAIFARGGCHGGGGVTADFIHTVATGDKVYSVQGTMTLTPTPQGGFPRMILPELPTPECHHEGSHEYDRDNATLTYYPGRYPNGIQPNRDANGPLEKVIFEPGIYCVEGDVKISHSGEQHGPHGADAIRVEGYGVTFYMQSGKFQLHHVAADLRAPGLPGTSGPLTDDAGHNWKGMLLYMPATNTGGWVKLAGHGTLTLQGTIYAPGARSSRHGGGHARCMIGGHEDVGPDDPDYPADDDPEVNKDEGYLQIVCDTVRVHGHSNVTLRYNASYFYSIPVLDVTK